MTQPGASSGLTFDPRHQTDWKLDPSRLIFTDRLGAGTSAKVYKGLYDGKPVAIKILNFSDSKMLKDFEKECEIMSSVRSAHVLHFYGTLLAPKVCIVVEYCPRGTLFQFISDPSKDVTWARVLKWMVEIAKGLLTLHSCQPAVLHRDLKTLNILLDREGSIKLCDFGKSRLAPLDEANKDVTLCKIRGTYAYSAPEVYFGEQFSTKSDVYSIGVVLWEILYRCISGTYQRPFGEYPNIVAGPMLLIKTAKQHLRPTIPIKAPQELSDLIQSCWHPKYPERPDASRILEILIELKEKFDADAERQKEWEGLRQVIGRRASVSEEKKEKETALSAECLRGHITEQDEEEEGDDDEDDLMLRNATLAKRIRRRSWLQSLREPLSSEDLRDLQEFEAYYSKYGIVQLNEDEDDQEEETEPEAETTQHYYNTEDEEEDEGDEIHKEEALHDEHGDEEEEEEKERKAEKKKEERTLSRSAPVQIEEKSHEESGRPISPKRTNFSINLPKFEESKDDAFAEGLHSPPKGAKREVEKWNRKGDIIERAAMAYETEKSPKRHQKRPSLLGSKAKKSEKEPSGLHNERKKEKEKGHEKHKHKGKGKEEKHKHKEHHHKHREQEHHHLHHSKVRKEKLKEEKKGWMSEGEGEDKRKGKKLIGRIRSSSHGKKKPVPISPGANSVRKARLNTLEMLNMASEERENCPEGMECTSMEPTHYLLYQHTLL